MLTTNLSGDEICSDNEPSHDLTKPKKTSNRKRRSITKLNSPSSSDEDVTETKTNQQRRQKKKSSLEHCKDRKNNNKYRNTSKIPKSVTVSRKSHKTLKSTENPLEITFLSPVPATPVRQSSSISEIHKISKEIQELTKGLTAEELNVLNGEMKRLKTCSYEIFVDFTKEGLTEDQIKVAEDEQKTMRAMTINEIISKLKETIF